MKRRRKASRPSALRASNPTAALSAYHLRLHHAPPVPQEPEAQTHRNGAETQRTFLDALFTLAPKDDPIRSLQDLTEATTLPESAKSSRSVKRRRRAVKMQLANEDAANPSEDDLCIAEAGFPFEDLAPTDLLGACQLVVQGSVLETKGLQVRINRGEVERFVGDAEHWLGASLEQFLALETLIAAKVVMVRAELRRGDGDSAEVCIKYWFNGTGLCRDGEIDLPVKTTKAIATVMEWVYPGSVSVHVKKPESASNFAAVELFAKIKPSASAPTIRQEDLPAGCLAQVMYCACL